MKKAVFFFVIAAILGLTSCCRYRGPMYWDNDASIPFEIEKKDLKKAGDDPRKSSSSCADDSMIR